MKSKKFDISKNWNDATIFFLIEEFINFEEFEKFKESQGAKNLTN